MNLVGAFRGQNLKLPIIFKNVEKNKKNLSKTENFYSNSGFGKINFGFRCNSKTNYRRYIQFLPVVYINIFYTQ